MYFLSSRSTTLFSLEKICLNYFHKLESKVSSYRNGSDEVANLKKNVKIRKCVKESIRESNEELRRDDFLRVAKEEVIM